MSLTDLTLDFIYLLVSVLGEPFVWLAGWYLVMIFMDALISIVQILRR